MQFDRYNRGILSPLHWPTQRAVESISVVAERRADIFISSPPMAQQAHDTPRCDIRKDVDLASGVNAI